MKNFNVLIRLIDNDGIEVLKKVYPVKVKTNSLRISDIMLEVERLFAKEYTTDIPEWFGVKGFLFGETVDSYPENSVYSTFQKSTYQSIIADTTTLLNDWCKQTSKSFTFNGMEVTAKINIYQTGYGFAIINEKSSSGLYGAAYDLYLNKITTKCVKSSNSNDAITFDTPIKALAYLKKYESVFKFMHEQKGWNFELKPTNDFARNDLADMRKMTPKQSEAYMDIIKTLSFINYKDTHGYEYPPINDDKTPSKEELKEEAIRRLTAIGATEVLKAFKNNKLFRSEYHQGILYDIDEEDKKDIANIEKNGNLVYHIIKSKFRMTDGQIIPNFSLSLHIKMNGDMKGRMELIIL